MNAVNSRFNITRKFVKINVNRFVARKTDMFEIFKTNVKNPAHANALIVVLQHYLPFAEINFDLDDCDSILRVKGGKFCTLTIIQILADLGFECHVLV